MAAGLFGVFGYDMVRLLEPLGPVQARAMFGAAGLYQALLFVRHSAPPLP